MRLLAIKIFRALSRAKLEIVLFGGFGFISREGAKALSFGEFIDSLFVYLSVFAPACQVQDMHCGGYLGVISAFQCPVPNLSLPIT